MAKKKVPNPGKKVRRIARNVIGVVPSEKVIVPRTERKKPKHKKPAGMEEES